MLHAEMTLEETLTPHLILLTILRSQSHPAAHTVSDLAHQPQIAAAKPRLAQSASAVAAVCTACADDTHITEKENRWFIGCSDVLGNLANANLRDSQRDAVTHPLSRWTGAFSKNTHEPFRQRHAHLSVQNVSQQATGSRSITVIIMIWNHSSPHWCSVIPDYTAMIVRL